MILAHLITAVDEAETRDKSCEAFKQSGVRIERIEKAEGRHL